jgi:hypothetical protein
VDWNWVNVNNIGIILGILIALASAYYAHSSAASAAAANRTAESAKIYQVLLDILMEYRSVEMLHAVRTLWDYYRTHQTDLVEAYQTQLQIDTAAISKLPSDKVLDAEKATLHFQRRLVSQFYQFLGGIYESKVVSKEVLYTYWSESDLSIIPKILMPIEIKLAESLGVSKDSPGLKRLQKLYDDSKS